MSSFSILIFIAVLFFIVFTFIFFRVAFHKKKQFKTEILSAPPTGKSPVQKTPVLSDEQRIAKGLNQSKAFFQSAFDRLFTSSEGEKFFNNLEEVLLTADVGIQSAEKISSELKKSFGVRLPNRTEMKSAVSKLLVSEFPLSPTHGFETQATGKPHIILIVGVNGSGKTTTIAKLCERFHAHGKKVLVGAADTFRAAAIDQLKIWVQKTDSDIVSQVEGADPSAVAFDAVNAAKSRSVDFCIIDTAGRLHTKSNLMEELKKMKRVIGKSMPGAPHDIWMILDGTTGQNALYQARQFHEALTLTGIIVTKLDGTAKGGSIIAVSSALQVPVIYIGVGESSQDLIPFHPPQFVNTLLEGL